MYVLLQTIKEPFKRPAYVVFALAISLLVILITIWLPMHEFITSIISSEVISTASKAKILLSSIGAFKTNFTFISQIITILIALLAGINMSLVVFYFKRRFAMQSAAGTSTLGILGGFLGVGCSACGSVVLSSIFGIGATAGFIGFLPLKGSEFGIISILILLFSLFLSTKKLQSSPVCGIDKKFNT